MIGITMHHKYSYLSSLVCQLTEYHRRFDETPMSVRCKMTIKLVTKVQKTQFRGKNRPRVGGTTVDHD